MKRTASIGFIFLVIFLAAFYLPLLYGKIFFDDIEKTHLFYSPVAKEFVFKEKVVGKVPDAVRQKAEDHHAEIAYRMATGAYISRVEFEKRLPFIFYKNMEIWGLLPLELDGRLFDAGTIRQHRRVLELKSGYISGNSPIIPVHPLLESNPGQARLVFPDDRFRMAPAAMEFINADSNRVDPDLTRTFTRALKEKGFVFPARSVNGKFTVLKPFDEGVFLVDDGFAVFHVKRVDGRPHVVKTPIDPSIKTRHIQVSENTQKKYYGLLLDHSGRVHLLSQDNYHLIPLPLKAYEPDRMDLKLIFNPLYVTAVYSDEKEIHAVAMDKNFEVIDAFTHTMSRSKTTLSRKIFAAIFPFYFRFESSGSNFFNFNFYCNGWFGLVGILASLCLYLVKTRAIQRKKVGIWPMLLVSATGIFGVAALEFTGMDD